MTKRNGNGNGHSNGNGAAHNGDDVTLRSCFVLTTSSEASTVRKAIEAFSKKSGEAVLDEGEMRFTRSTIGVPFHASSRVIGKLESKGYDIRYNGSCPSPI